MRPSFLSIMVALGITIWWPDVVVAQTAKDLVGTWTMVSNINIRDDGGRKDVFGPHGKGSVIFESNGHFALVNVNPDAPKFASGNRAQGTADENKTAVLGGLAFFGTYSVKDKVLYLKIEGSTYPNWTGTEQMRPIVSFSPPDFKWALQASVGGTGEVTWRRIK